MLLFPLTIFLSAFLLFQVQPLMGKYILPWFGGGPAVWTACLLFFQLLLLGGYLYAHCTSTWFSLRVQGWLHMALLAASGLLLPIVPQASWKPLTAGDPTVRILLLLLATVGMPYFLLSATGPLLQRWFNVSLPGRSPYRLYALSNAGSFLALLSYPVAVEPYLRLGNQVNMWSWSYGVFAALCAACAWRISQTAAAAVLPESGEAVTESAPPDWGTLLFWLGLSACGSILLLSTTSQLCQEVAVIPFLWILPLAIYLLAFIVCFERDAWYSRRWFALLFALAVPMACKVLVKGLEAPLLTSIPLDTLKRLLLHAEYQPLFDRLLQHLPLYTVTLLAGCMCCFGELVRSKPHPRHLTLFYLLIAVGGAIGGILVAVVAPRVLVENREYHLGLALCGALTLIGWWRSRAWQDFEGRPFWVAAPMTGLLTVTLFTLVAAAYGRGYTSIRTQRNFYGILRVSEHSDEVGSYYSLSHGGTLHGFQYLDPDKREWPTSYYGPESGAGLALNHHPARFTGNGAIRAAVIGLGTGSIAVHGRPGDNFRFYEINPIVEELSKSFFTYRMDSKARVEIDMGDARVRLEQEAAEGQLQHLDVIAVDAFSSDAIPSHLLTAECADVYRRHLNPDGILAIHISNRFLDLAPVVRALAQRLGWQAVRIDSDRDDSKGVYSATWILVTANQKFLRTHEVSLVIDPFTKEDKPPLLWTDDFVSLWRILK